MLLLAALAPACGEGTVVVVNIAPSATITQPAGAQSGSSVTITYNLIDAESDPATIVVEFSVNSGGSFAPATAALGGDGTSGLTTSPTTGTAHTFNWNSLADVGAVNSALVRIRITPSDSQLGTAGSTTDFTVNNAGNVIPVASLVSTTGTSGLIVVTYTLTDTESNACSVVVEYAIGAGGFSAMTMGPGGDGTTNLAAAGAGTVHTFLWNSVQDIPSTMGSTALVAVRVTPSDGVTGTASTSATLTVDNTANPSGGGASLTDEPTVFNEPSLSATDGTNLYIVGEEDVTASNTRLRFEKRLAATGALVAAFDGDGILTNDAGTGRDRPTKLVIDGTAMYVAVQKETGSGMDTFNAYLEKRLLTTGALVTSFNTTGTLTLASLGGGAPLAIAVDGSFIYIAFGENVSATNYRWHIEKRNKLTGALDASFGTAGVVTEDVLANADAPESILIDDTYMWLGGVYDYDVSGGGATDGKARYEKRLLSTGALVPAFGGAGFVNQTVVTTDDWEVKDLVSDGTSLFSMVYVSTGIGGDSWRLEKRSLVDGSLTTTVTSTAVASNNGGDHGNYLFIDGGRLYVGGTANIGAGDDLWRLEKRLLTTLALDTSFDTDGILTYNPSGGTDSLKSFVVTGGLIFSAGSSSTGGTHWLLGSVWK